MSSPTFATSSKDLPSQNNDLPCSKQGLSLGFVGDVSRNWDSRRGNGTKERSLPQHSVDVDDGSTVTDFLPAERARGITIQSAAITFHWPPRLPENNPTAALQPHTINLIDTPGHADFTFEVLRSLRVLDGAVCILDGVAGVEAQTEKVWHQANNYRIPRIIYINKLDRDGAAFGATVKQIPIRLHSYPAVCQIPWWEGGRGRFVGIGDVVNLRGMKWEEGGDGKAITTYDLQQLAEAENGLCKELKRARVALVELLTDFDEQMVEEFLQYDSDHLAIPGQQITKSLRKCLLSGSARLIPVLAGASFKNIGVQPLLDAVNELLPDPTESPDPKISLGAHQSTLKDLPNILTAQESTSQVAKMEGKSITLSTSKKATSMVHALDCCALAFKVVNDPRRGVLVYVRVYSGAINRSTVLYNTSLQLSERAPRLLEMHASEAVEVESIPAGQIGVIVGLKHARTGDTLISYSGAKLKAAPPAPLSLLQLRPIDVPPPVFFASIEPDSSGAEKQVRETLDLLLREDPSLQVTVDEDSGQTLLSGMGELHLEIAHDRLVGDFKAKASMGRIEIGYRECILAPSDQETRIFDRDIAGRKGKAGCTASITTLSAEQAITSHSTDNSNSTSRDGNLITINFPTLSPSGKPKDPLTAPIPSHLSQSSIRTALINGASAALARGPKHSFPMHSAHVTLTLTPSEHIFGADSTPAALTSAARIATKAALNSAAEKGGTTLMEPVMNVLISVDESSLGAVMQDISSTRGGHVTSLNDNNNPNISLSPNTNSEEDLPIIDITKIYAPPDPFGNTLNSADTNVGDVQNAAVSDLQRNITAKVPLKEMVGYMKHLRSLTGGRGTFVMSVDRFERMGSMREKLVLAEMRGLRI
ncbi:MAG: Ribosome-releasing factor 2, mitochondrial [Candelaria pacifica]|nr:MAG: Ribosome-releasing factor 2, mitochondrial [Candelaria pacifica]